MSSSEAYCDDFTESAVLWLSRWWATLAASAAIGALIAFSIHASAEPKYTARLDFVIPESALGSPAFVQSVSRTYLERESGDRATVSVSPNGTISIVSQNVGPDEVQARLSDLQSAVAGLRDMLNEQVAERYQLAQQDLRENPENGSAYMLMNHFRTYMDAHEAGLFEQVQVRNEGVVQTSLPMFNRLAIGLLVGLLIGTAIAMSITLVRRRS